MHRFGGRSGGASSSEDFNCGGRSVSTGVSPDHLSCVSPASWALFALLLMHSCNCGEGTFHVMMVCLQVQQGIVASGPLFIYIQILQQLTDILTGCAVQLIAVDVVSKCKRRLTQDADIE